MRRVFAALPLGIALAALLGHLAGYSALVTVLPELRAMSVLTALCIVLLSIALLAFGSAKEQTADLMAWATVAAGACVVASYVLVSEDLVSPYLSRGLSRLSEQPGRTSRSTALALMLVAASIISRNRPGFSDLCAVSSLVLATFALLGYAYGVGDLYALTLFNSMALNTALALFILSIGAMLLRPMVGWSVVIFSAFEAGSATRRQLSFTLLPPLVGWFLVLAIRRQWLGEAAAMATFVVATVIPLAILVLRDGKLLIALDAERHLKADALARGAQQMQQQLEAQSIQLRHESAERARVEAAMYRSQRLDAVGKLTGGIAHDFNNLLMAISGNLQFLKRRLPGDDPLLRFVNNAVGAVDKGTKVTGQLLAFSRTQRLAIVPTLIDPVLLSARELIGSSLGPDIQLELKSRVSGLWALCDADQLELALVNLAMNSRDAMPGGGTITIEATREMQPAAATDDNQGCLAIRLIDDGTGMEAGVAAHAAEPFFTTKERGKGTGLGLAQVYGFVAQCGGQFLLKSELGKGTTVEMRFRLSMPKGGSIAEPALGALPAWVEAAGVQRRVLVIDDDDCVREILVSALEAAGYQVAQAADGASGLARLQEFEPAVAVIDFIMPGMNGAEVARIAQARLPGLPIVFVSGFSDTLALESVPGASLLRKPFDVQLLTRTVEQAIAQS